RDLLRAGRPSGCQSSHQRRRCARNDLFARRHRRARGERRCGVSRASARSPAAPRRRGVLRHLACARGCRRPVPSEETRMSHRFTAALAIAAAAAIAAPLGAAQIKVSLDKETVGKTPVTFEPMVGTWVVVKDGNDKAIMVDGRPWTASKDNPTKLLVESARRLYGTSNEALMDNAKQFAY